MELDRAHQIGRKDTQEGSNRVRPLIVRFSFYKDKEVVLKKGYLFKGSNISASQDFSKMTIDLHKKLCNEAKKAQSILNDDPQQSKAIISYRVTYK